MANTQKQFATWLQGMAVETLTYESLIAEEGFGTGVTDAFSRVFGRPPSRELRAAYVKILPRLHDVIENRQAVLDHFAGTEFETWVGATLTD